jgi:hypothetical protein
MESTRAATYTRNPRSALHRVNVQARYQANVLRGFESEFMCIALVLIPLSTLIPGDGHVLDLARNCGNHF